MDFGTCGVPFMEVPLHNSLISLKLNWPMSGDDLGVRSCRRFIQGCGLWHMWSMLDYPKYRWKKISWPKAGLGIGVTFAFLFDVSRFSKYLY